ncbi:phosphonate metabolism transcriptional regulator PhnF [Roseivivax sediminis]|uniref:GntR family transcriptional regulator, phosphonate transport system regulatory protein n=1 Tax=Roseivivax sediminis TaxID=936889 RepID=A0A1I2A125_9RHOB|nr:phosphonate metabolism transcriptional regulator PhnF [Roseivivax sediminis]SFE37665.1 GntR family transcriptional regulator, phosphonate transport system regulatory protein [Roseivivax sediminis]
MPRNPVWKAIAKTLETEIAERLYPPGARLPTEAALSDRFGVNRHTVRRALSDLSERGLVRSRRGAGVFVDIVPTDYALGRRVRFHQNLRAAGHLPEKRVLRIETRPARRAEAEALDLDRESEVVVYEGLSLSDGIAIAHFESVFPAARLPGLAAALAETASVTEALARAGVADYVRAETRISAERASATQALHLGLRDGEPVLCTISRNETPEGMPVERGTTWFAGDRVALVHAG